MIELLFVGSSNMLKLSALTNVDTGSFINDATVTATIEDLAGDNVVRVTSPAWPITLDYVVASDGIYSAPIHDMTLVEGKKYLVILNITAGSAIQEKRNLCYAKYPND